MEPITLSGLIGDEITDLRYHYTCENEYSLQEFHAYIQLKSGRYIGIPQFDDDVYLADPGDHYKLKFETGEMLQSQLRELVIGTTIVDFHFSYNGEEIEDWHSGYIQSDSGIYLMERNYGPQGLLVSMSMLSENDFTRIKAKSDIRSFLAMKNGKESG